MKKTARVPGPAERERFQQEAMPHLDSLYRAALHFCRDRSQAEDLVQETFKEALASFHRFAPGSHCKAWLFRILFRVRSRFLRNLSRFRPVALEDLPEEKASVPSHAAAVEARNALKMLSSLPEHYQTVLVLSDVEDLSYREISQILEIPMGTVMSRLNRARGLMRSRLGKSRASGSG